jgi:hypothetical protein
VKTYSTRHSIQTHLAASLTAYLEGLQESGLDGIPPELMSATIPDTELQKAIAPKSDRDDVMNAQQNTTVIHETLE